MYQIPDKDRKLQLLKEECAKHPKGQDDLIEVLHFTQETFGFIPEEAIDVISETLEVPKSVVYGVITFYHFFSLFPPGKHTIRICLGTACYVKGGKKIMETLESELGIKVGETTKDGLFSIQPARCLGACGLAPVMMVGEEVYARLTPKKVREILNKYREEEKVNA